MDKYKKMWEQLKIELEKDRDNTGEMMSLAESIYTSANAKHYLTKMKYMEQAW